MISLNSWIKLSYAQGKDASQKYDTIHICKRNCFSGCFLMPSLGLLFWCLALPVLVNFDSIFRYYNGIFSFIVNISVIPNSFPKVVNFFHGREVSMNIFFLPFCSKRVRHWTQTNCFTCKTCFSSRIFVLFKFLLPHFVVTFNFVGSSPLSWWESISFPRLSSFSTSYIVFTNYLI